MLRRISANRFSFCLSPYKWSISLVIDWSADGFSTMYYDWNRHDFSPRLNCIYVLLLIVTKMANPQVWVCEIFDGECWRVLWCMCVDIFFVTFPLQIPFCMLSTPFLVHFHHHFVNAATPISLLSVYAEHSVSRVYFTFKYSSKVTCSR
jgi:hypothetical protein